MNFKAKIEPYDFKRNGIIPNPSLGIIKKIHEDFSKEISNSLALLLKEEAQIILNSIDQIPFEEFIRSIPNPTNLAIAEINPDKNFALLEMNPFISLALLDKLCGGEGEPLNVNRSLTKLEIFLVENFIKKFFTKINSFWDKSLEAKLNLLKITTNPEISSLLPLEKDIFLIKFKIHFGDIEGFINFCFPSSILKVNLAQLSKNYNSLPTKKITKKKDPSLLKNLLKTEVALQAEISKIKISLQDLLDLKTGDIIKLPNKKWTEETIIKIGEVKKLKAQSGLRTKTFALKVTNFI